MSIRSALLALSVFAAAPAGAQSPAAPELGTRLRVQLTPDSPDASEGPAIGTLVARSESVILLDRGGRRGIDTIPQSQVRRIDIATGRRSLGANVLRGTWIGGAILGGAGLIAGAALHNGYECYDGGFCVSAGGGALVGGVLGMATGALLGLMSGSTTQWQRGQPAVRVSFTPTGRGTMMVGLSISH